MAKRTARHRKSPARPAIHPPSPLAQRAPYRVFISYSHSDKKYAQQIAQILENNGIKPMWDRDFACGQGFHDQIKRFIAHSHVFLPILTRVANHRKWVHEEIGYAMALNIPTLPVAIGDLPAAMIQQLHALQLDASQISRLKNHLTQDAIESLVMSRRSDTETLYTCAMLPGNRAVMIAGYAQEVLALREFGTIRQKGGLSSFHIPKQTVSHGLWKERYGNLQREEEHCRNQRLERRTLEKHARVAGCKIIVNPRISYEKYGAQAQRSRLGQLRDFLQSMPDSHCQVAIKEGMGHHESVTIVGNWIAATSTSAELGKGYFQTIFTRHAPSVIDAVESFDEEFDELLKAKGVEPDDSRQYVINYIQAELDALKDGDKQ